MSKEITNVSIDVLKVHPRNTEFFDDISGKEYEVNFLGKLRNLLNGKEIKDSILLTGKSIGIYVNE